MKTSILALTGIAATGIWAAGAAAEPLNKAWIAADATWVVHVDAEAALGSTMGRFLVANRDELGLHDLERIKRETGLDPLVDIRGVTVYGSGLDAKDGVAVISTTAAAEAMIEKLRASEPGFTQLTEGKYTIFSWTEHNMPRFAQVRKGKTESDRVVLVAGDKARLLAGIRVMDGGEAPVVRDPSGLMARSPKPGSIFFAIASDLGSAEAMPFSRAKGLVVDMGEADAEVFAEVTVVPKETEDLTNLMQVMQGSVAMVRMMAQSDPKLAELSKIAQGLSFDTDGRQISANLRYGTDKLMQSLVALKNAQNGGGAGRAPATKTGNNQDEPGGAGR